MMRRLAGTGLLGGLAMIVVMMVANYGLLVASRRPRGPSPAGNR